MALSMKSASGVTARAAKPAAAKSMMVWTPNNK
jgi:hypothetical protein